MTPDETNCFILLDDYARTRHKCSLTEFFLNTIQTDYVLCFRPAVGSKDSPDRYVCRYLYIAPDLVRMVGQNKSLPERITDLLDRELPEVAES